MTSFQEMEIKNLSSAKKKLGIIWFLIGMVFLFFCFNQNYRKPVHHHDSEIWSDKAGYYVYLPATFIYSWNGKSMPPNIDSLSGDGFQINKSTGSIYTKYPPGVALLETPIFLAAHALQLIYNPKQANGFTKPYHAARLVSGVFWLFLGFYFLGLISLNAGRSLKETVWLLFIFLLGTSVAYSTIWQPCMSHGYSLFSITWLVWLLQNVGAKNRWLWIGLAFGLIGSIRAVNLILLVPFLLLYIQKYWQDIKKAKTIILTVSGFLISMLPAIVHFFYLRSFGTKPYEGEAFTHAANPWFLEIFFSATNGIAIYTPLLFILLAILFLGNFNHENRKIAIFITASFFALTWLYASWWVPTMGCSIGHRSFIDFLPLLFLYFVVAITKKIIFNKYFILFACLAMLYTSYLSFHYPGCLNDGNGQVVWNWSEYMRVLIPQ